MQDVRFILILFSLLMLSTASALAQSIYRCEHGGDVTFTNVEEEAKGCKRIKIVVPPSSTKKYTSSSPTVAEVNFPRVDSDTQKKRDVGRDELIRKELENEKQSLLILEEKLSKFQIIGGADQQKQIDEFKKMSEERSARAKNIEELEKQILR